MPKKRASEPRRPSRRSDISPNPKKRIARFYRELEKEFGTQRAQEIIRRIGIRSIIPAFARKDFGPEDLQVLRHTATVQNDIIELERKKLETR